MKRKLLGCVLITVLTLSACASAGKADHPKETVQGSQSLASDSGDGGESSSDSIEETEVSGRSSEDDPGASEPASEKQTAAAPEISKEALFEKIRSASNGLHSFHIKKDTVYDISGEDAKTLVRKAETDACYKDGNFDRSHSVVETSLKGQDTSTENYIIRQDEHTFMHFESTEDGGWESAQEQDSYIIPNYFGLVSLLETYPDFWTLTTEGEEYLLTFDLSNAENLDDNIFYDVFSHTDSRLYMNVLMLTTDMIQTLKFSMTVNSQNFYIEAYDLSFAQTNEMDTVTSTFSAFNEILPESISAPE